MSIQKQVAPILITTAMIWELTLRLLLAGILGAVIGLDREYRAKEAGFRTHFLVSLGSALFMIISNTVLQRYSTTIRPSNSIPVVLLLKLSVVLAFWGPARSFSKSNLSGG